MSFTVETKDPFLAASNILKNRADFEEQAQAIETMFTNAVKAVAADTSASEFYKGSVTAAQHAFLATRDMCRQGFSNELLYMEKISAWMKELQVLIDTGVCSFTKLPNMTFYGYRISFDEWKVVAQDVLSLLGWLIGKFTHDRLVPSVATYDQLRAMLISSESVSIEKLTYLVHLQCKSLLHEKCASAAAALQSASKKAEAALVEAAKAAESTLAAANTDCNASKATLQAQIDILTTASVETAEALRVATEAAQVPCPKPPPTKPLVSSMVLAGQSLCIIAGLLYIQHLRKSSSNSSR